MSHISAYGNVQLWYVHGSVAAANGGRNVVAHENGPAPREPFAVPRTVAPRMNAQNRRGIYRRHLPASPPGRLYAGAAAVGFFMSATG